MKVNKHAVVLVFATLLLVTNINAGEPCRKFLGCPVPDCIGKWCCDDYKSKCLPCVKVPLCLGCDDYCRKSMPRVCTPLCFSCDDYCQKCQPPVCRPPLLSTLRCVPGQGACGCTTCSPSSCDQGTVISNHWTPSLFAPTKVASHPSAIAPVGTETVPVETVPVETVPAETRAVETRAVETGEQNARRPVIIEIFKR